VTEYLFLNNTTSKESYFPAKLWTTSIGKDILLRFSDISDGGSSEPRIEFFMGNQVTMFAFLMALKIVHPDCVIQ